LREAVGMSNRRGESDNGPLRVDVEQSHRISEVTIAHYDRLAEAYWDGTRDHDVTQNYTALLDAIEGDPPYSILDLGCGPGRDLHHFRGRVCGSPPTTRCTAERPAAEADDAARDGASNQDRRTRAHEALRRRSEASR
jgi:SAM-dependent methyltransferase